MRKLKICIFATAISLSACGSWQVYDENGLKRIEYHNSSLAYPRIAAYNTHEAVTDLSVIASRECPAGFEKVKQEYVADDGTGKDQMIWYVKCLESEQ